MNTGKGIALRPLDSGLQAMPVYAEGVALDKIKKIKKGEGLSLYCN